MASEVETLDTSKDELGGAQAPACALEHPGIGVDPNETNSGFLERPGQSPGANPEIQDGRRGGLGQLEPRPEVDCIRELRVELREGRLGAGRVIANDASGYAAAWSPISSALSMMAKPSASSSLLMQSGGFVMTVCHRRKV